MALNPVASFLESFELTSENGQCCLSETFDMEGVLQAPVRVFANERTASQYFKSDQKFFISNTFFQSAFSSQAVSSAYFLKKINGTASFPLYISHRQLLI